MLDASDLSGISIVRSPTMVTVLLPGFLPLRIPLVANSLLFRDQSNASALKEILSEGGRGVGSWESTNAVKAWYETSR